MAGVSDNIERFIIELFDDDEYSVELKRNELAHYFGCAPSQINYVLSTRFTIDRGYVITSRRGGSGSISIVKLQTDDNDLYEFATERVGDQISVRRAQALLQNLNENGLISPREAAMMYAAIQDVPMVKPSLRDYIRAVTLKNMLIALLDKAENEGE